MAKLFFEELGTTQMIALVEPLSAAEKLTSVLTLIEFRSTLRRKERSLEIAQNAASEVQAAFEQEIATFAQQPLNSTVVGLAEELIDKYPLRALDAIQLASCAAARASSGISDILFVSSDHALLAAAEAERFPIFDPAST